MVNLFDKRISGGTQKRRRRFAQRSQLENVRRRIEFQCGPTAVGVFGPSYCPEQQNSRIGRGHGQR